MADAAARGVVIGRDSRIPFGGFACVTAGVLAACGIRVYLFDDLRPTPMVSFAVRDLHAVAGVNITASHNPKEYNGYKVYYEDGAQISPAQAEKISAEIEKIPVPEALSGVDFERARADGRIVMLGGETDERYLERVLAERVDPTLIPRAGDRLRIVYTPFHGAGRRLVPEASAAAGCGSFSRWRSR